VTEAMNKIFEVCKTEDPDKAAVFLVSQQPADAHLETQPGADIRV